MAQHVVVDHRAAAGVVGVVIAAASLSRMVGGHGMASAGRQRPTPVRLHRPQGPPRHHAQDAVGAVPRGHRHAQPLRLQDPHNTGSGSWIQLDLSSPHRPT